MKRLCAGLLCLMSALTACVGQDARCTALPGGGRYCLQATSMLMPVAVQQKVALLFNGRHETMIVELEVDNDGMRFAGLTPFGQKLVQASYDNHQVSFELSPDKRIEPVFLLALLQLAIWPADSVRAGLGGSVVLDERVGQRRLLEDGKVVAEVSYTGGQPPFGDMRIVFPSLQMEFTVTTLDANGAQ